MGVGGGRLIPGPLYHDLAKGRGLRAIGASLLCISSKFPDGADAASQGSLSSTRAYSDNWCLGNYSLGMRVLLQGLRSSSLLAKEHNDFSLPLCFHMQILHEFFLSRLRAQFGVLCVGFELEMLR